MRQGVPPVAGWDVSALNESRVKLFVSASQTMVKTVAGSYLTLNRITADRSEKQLARFNERSGRVGEWLIRELRKLESDEPMVKLRLRQWEKGGHGRSGVVFMVKKKGSGQARPAARTSRVPERNAKPSGSGELVDMQSAIARASSRKDQVGQDALKLAQQQAEHALRVSETAEKRAKESADEASKLRERVEELEADVSDLRSSIEKQEARIESMSETQLQAGEAILGLVNMVCGE